MLKMVGEGARGPQRIKVVALGLSHKNIERLKAGQPIIFQGEDVNIPNVEFIIFSGETEQSMARELSDLVGPNTNTKIDPRGTDA